MRTIGKRWPSSAPRGDYQAECSYCGVRWLRSLLRRDRSGNLTCPDEGRGRDAVHLSELNAHHASRPGSPVRPYDGGGWHKPDPLTQEATHVLDLDDPELLVSESDEVLSVPDGPVTP